MFNFINKYFLFNKNLTNLNILILNKFILQQSKKKPNICNKVTTVALVTKLPNGLFAR